MYDKSHSYIVIDAQWATGKIESFLATCGPYYGIDKGKPLFSEKCCPQSAFSCARREQASDLQNGIAQQGADSRDGHPKIVRQPEQRSNLKHGSKDQRRLFEPGTGVGRLRCDFPSQ